MSSRAAHCCAFCAPRSLLGSIKECLMDCPWYPSENAHTEVSGPIPSSCAPYICFLEFRSAEADIGFFCGTPTKTRLVAISITRKASICVSTPHILLCMLCSTAGPRYTTAGASPISSISTGKRGGEIGGTSCMNACITVVMLCGNRGSHRLFRVGAGDAFSGHSFRRRLPR